ncbi:MAG: carbon-nitrogen hydrolase family protein, partial [Bacteroidota bacterium]
MKVTVCEISDNESEFSEDWELLKIHLMENPSDLLLLPEMPFCEWIASELPASEEKKKEAVNKHLSWLERFDELNVDQIVYSRPVIDGQKYYNSAFLWQKHKGNKQLHSKQYFPEEEHFWEASWYDADDKGFSITDFDGLKIGVLLCTEVWFTQHARAYGEQGVDILLCPRATGKSSVAQWKRCGQTLAVISGAYCLSSNRSGIGKNNFLWGGAGNKLLISRLVFVHSVSIV